MGTKKSSVGVVLGIVFIALACATAWAVQRVYDDSRHDKSYAQIVSDVRIQATRLGVYAKDAAAGDRKAMAELESLQKVITSSFKTLFDGNPVDGVPASPAEASGALSTANAKWIQLQDHADKIITANRLIQDRLALINTADKSARKLLNLSDSIASNLVKQDAASAQVYIATRQSALVKNILDAIGAIQSNDPNYGEIAKNLNAHTVEFQNALRIMIEGDGPSKRGIVTDRATRAVIGETRSAFIELNGAITQLLANAPKYEAVSKAAVELTLALVDFDRTLVSLVNEYGDLAHKRQLTPFHVSILAASTGIVLLLIIVHAVSTSYRAADAAKLEKDLMAQFNQDRKQELETLLKEMAPVAEGDLTSIADTSHSTTAPIAKAFNRSVEFTRRLADAVKAASANIASAAEQSNRTVHNLKQTRMESVRLINQTSSLAKEMDDSIRSINAHAEDTARQSEVSLSFVLTGWKAVESTHTAVEKAESSIRSSSEMVKKLAEEIQTIDTVNDAIQEITDKTRMLAYNTALIADRSSGPEKAAIAAAAKEMEALTKVVHKNLVDVRTRVSAISSKAADTQEQIETSRGDVMKVVNSSNDALKALAEIQTATKESYRLVTNIKDETIQLTNVSSRFVENVRSIERNASEQAAASEHTATAVASLSGQATELNKLISSVNT